VFPQPIPAGPSWAAQNRLDAEPHRSHRVCEYGAEIPARAIGSKGYCSRHFRVTRMGTVSDLSGALASGTCRGENGGQANLLRWIGGPRRRPREQKIHPADDRPLGPLISPSSPVADRKLPSCNAGEDDAWVCSNDLKSIRAVIDDEKDAGRNTQRRNLDRVSAGAVGVHRVCARFASASASSKSELTLRSPRRSAVSAARWNSSWDSRRRPWTFRLAACKPRLKRAVEDGIARVVDDVGENDGVLVGECWGTIEVGICRGEQPQQQTFAVRDRLRRLAVQGPPVAQSSQKSGGGVIAVDLIGGRLLPWLILWRFHKLAPTGRFELNRPPKPPRRWTGGLD
jgi:hypothetical protein